MLIKEAGSRREPALGVVPPSRSQAAENNGPDILSGPIQDPGLVPDPGRQFLFGLSGLVRVLKSRSGHQMKAQALPVVPEGQELNFEIRLLPLLPQVLEASIPGAEFWTDKKAQTALLRSQGGQGGQDRKADRGIFFEPVQIIQVWIGLGNGRKNDPALEPAVPGIVDC